MPLKSDHRRLPRRNQYQEGPDFLFVATQGGRPRAAEPVRDFGGSRPGAARAVGRWAEGATADDACALGGCSPGDPLPLAGPPCPR